MSHAIANHRNIFEQVHQRAMDISACYKKSESELMDVFAQIERHKVYFHYDCSSLFQYGLKVLGLSESVIYNLIAVMRKSREVPELRAAVGSGSITLSNARKIAPVLTKDNQDEWLKKGERAQ